MIRFDTEEDLKRFIIENKDYLLSEFDLNIYDNFYDEIALGAYGRCDIISYDISFYHEKIYLNISLIELKNNKSDINDLMQLCRYATAIKKFIKDSEYYNDIKLDFNAYLVTPSINMSSDMVLLYNFLSSEINIITFSLDPVEGIVLELEEKCFVKSNCDNLSLDSFLPEFSEKLKAKQGG